MSTTISADGDREQPIKKNVKKSFTDTLNEVNKGWGILDELGQNKFEIPVKSKSENIEAIEKNIVTSAKSDAEVIKRLESSSREAVNVGFQEINKIKQEEALLSTESVSQSSVPKVTASTPVQQVEQNQSLKLTDTVQVSLPASTKEKKVIQEKISTTELKNDKNLFFRFVMKGLAQLYMGKITTIFNPVVFIIKNFKALMQTVLLLGIPAIITWFLFNKVSNLQNLFSSVSTALYWFYALMFYMASLFLCLTLRVLGSGIWVMVGKSITEVAEKASVESK